ncbi:hypothetical protein [Pedomonas sp. V897]|uniref:hypothetical protein n=1 Tax=Pedomonas sp. V897 TaxID=3446482 RepID=UPI003EDFC3B0
MIPALGIAVSGLIDASNRAATAASNIVSDGAAAANFSLHRQDVLARYARASGSGSTASLGGQAQPGVMPRYIPSMAEDVVMMREAVQAYKANANVIRQLDKTTSELLNVLRTDRNH